MFPNPYGFRDSWGFAKPMGNPRETRTPEQGCGFPRVGVRVAPKNPRVARRIPYSQDNSPV